MPPRAVESRLARGRCPGMSLEGDGLWAESTLFCAMMELIMPCLLPDEFRCLSFQRGDRKKYRFRPGNVSPLREFDFLLPPIST